MTRLLDRRGLLAAAGMAAVAGCMGGGDEEATPTEEPTDSEPPSTETTESSTAGSTAGGPPTATERLPLPMEPAALREKAVSGGPPKDGIPSIDDPKFISASEAPDGLKPGDPVFGVVINGEVKAYSQRILAQHEICNDSFGDTPVSVTYCPLTGTAMGFLRGETTFGVSGRLVNNNLIMYDRATETWWPQVLATAIPGSWNENPEIRSLQQFPVVWTTWERWRTAHPNTKLLSRDTGYARSYDRDPYGSYNPRSGYYAREQAPMFPAISKNDDLAPDIPPKAVVIGARTPGGSASIVKNHLREEKLIEGTLGETPILAVYADSLDTGHLYRNPEARTFEYREGTVVEADGERYQPGDLPLDRLLSFDGMWFAWSGFYPETSVYV